MIHATQVRGPRRWSEPPADTVLLDFDDRPAAVGDDGRARA